MLRSDNPIIIENIFHCGIKELWDALTELSEMHQWYFDNLPEFRPEIGFKTSFPVSNEHRTFTHHWEITAVERLKRIDYSWNFDEYEGESISSFQLEEVSEGVKLSLVITTTEDFPSDIPEFTPESCESGWEYFLNGNLRKYLEG